MIFHIHIYRASLVFNKRFTVTSSSYWDLCSLECDLNQRLHPMKWILVIIPWNIRQHLTKSQSNPHEFPIKSPSIPYENPMNSLWNPHEIPMKSDSARLDGHLIVRLRIRLFRLGHSHLFLDVAGQGVDHLQDPCSENVAFSGKNMADHGKSVAKSWKNIEN